MSAEDAVRAYLRFLSDPDAMVDAEAVAEAERAVAAATDPVDKLRAIAQRERVATVDAASLEAAFVAEAKGWAAAEGVPVRAFGELGVDPGVLRRAGFEVAGGSARSASPSSPRRSRVSADDVRDAAIGFTELFTVADLEEATGASTGTVRRVIQELTEVGSIRDIGPDPDHTGPGRAPTRYDNS